MENKNKTEFQSTDTANAASAVGKSNVYMIVGIAAFVFVAAGLISYFAVTAGDDEVALSSLSQD